MSKLTKSECGNMFRGSSNSIMSKEYTLSQAVLTRMISDITRKSVENGEINIAFNPTHMIMVKYPDETTQEWNDRCYRANEVIKGMANE